ncbi:MAG TPA: type VI secretion system-associated protein TagF [Syntrophorhabdales bacterium]|nr:type VI secretion system-associated protein TagF [Syntrophorhabdales bacterium]
MLERLTSERRWQWAAYGKHPAAKDYFKLGQDFPLMSSFSGWIENGYQVLASKDNPVKARRSWRFWTKEARRENIVCGVVRDSKDSLGRPYPLLIMGTGPLKDWGSQWDLVPLACESVWGRMEYLSEKTFADLRELEDQILNITPPAAAWLELARKREGFGEPGPLQLRELEANASGLSGRTDCVIPVARVSSRDNFEMICLYHSFVRARMEAAPSAMFMGGMAEKLYVALFRRPLAPSDFIRLWSITPQEDNRE